MPKGVSTSVLQDLDRFVAVAVHLTNSPASFRMIASSMKPKVSPSVIKDTIDRLEKKYGKLIESGERTSGMNKLTEGGQKLLDNIRAMINWRPVGDLYSDLRITVSHTLLTSQLLCPPFRRFFEAVAPQVNVKLDLRAEFDFKRVIQDLQSNNLDLAIAWGTEQRRKHYPGVRFEEIGPNFDLVMISHSTQELEVLFNSRSEIAWEKLANKRVVILRSGSQPLLEKLPQPDFDNNGQHIQVGTIDGVVACVASKIGHFGIVPAIYPEMLDRYRSQDQIYWRKTNEKIRLAVFAPSPGVSGLPKYARNFLNGVEEYFNTFPNRSLFDEAAHHHYSTDPSFFEKMSHGYYIDDESGDWKWEKIKLKRLQSGEPAKFHGFINNMDRKEYEVEAVLLKGLFYYTATKQVGVVDNDRKISDLNSFVSVFPICLDDDKVIVGHWTGNVPGNRSHAAMYPSIYSHQPLTFDQVVNYSRRARILTVFHPNAGGRGNF